jgi:hypothetical protein
MKIKIISAGVIVSLLVGIAAMYNSAKPDQLPPETSPRPAAGGLPRLPDSGGHVVANDESPNSSPRQISLELPPIPMETVAARPKKLAQRTVIINNKEYPLRTYQPLALPNDPMASQWWVTNTNFDKAWEVPAGKRQTLLAIIDTGFALKHEEFINRWHTNMGESGSTTNERPSLRNCTDRALALNANCNLIDDDSDGTLDNESGAVTYQNPSRLNCTDQSKPLDRSCNRIDDDSNGHIDDTRGWDFINNDNSVQAGELNPSGTGTTHGTLVAGVAAATGNNSKGVAGADWGTKVLPIQAIDDDSYGDTLSVGRAIYYAAEQGADVISLSLGSYYPDDYVQEAVQFAIARGSVVVAASGNDGCDCIAYPANYPEVVAVGATDSSGGRANFSSWGANLDIVAPGTQITTSTWSSANQTSAYASNAAGTSFATPLVGGLLTRMLSSQENISPLQLVAALTENTNRLTIPATVTRDLKLGFGSMDALKGTNRMTAVRDTSLLYAFHPVSRGNSLAPASELIGQYVPHSCPDAVIGTTPIYELIKGGTRFFSISSSEMSKAVNTGYTSQLFAYSCLQQPQDTSSFIRSINVFSEFRNIFRALY